MRDSWISFWGGVSAFFFDIRWTMLSFVSGGFLLAMSEVLYRKYRDGMRKRRIMG
ncbi:MAG: hypothetical protein GKC03_06755 [Methanomassiliicoccales archaeon]|nr:hypothetical protein [Methanomassiliicoccales archaeon]NYT14769.1 hypothetical protein [Methanomassiliicoccales archaeon]